MFKKKGSGKNQLIKAVVHAFRHEYYFSIGLNLVGCILELANPFLVNGIIAFIQDKEIPNSHGIALVSALIGVQILNYLIFEQIKFYSSMTGIKSMSAMIALIY